MDYIIEFKSAIKNRLKKRQINSLSSRVEFNIEELDFKIPSYIQKFIKNMDSIEIRDNERAVEILTKSSISFLDKRYLQFCTMNKEIKVCFDLISINDANQCDIINYNNGFVITKSIESFLTNKVWAWIDRGRNVWDIELY
jgi:hypothetical protein